MKLQRQMLSRNPRVLVATPGRLIDHLEQKTITLREVSILILDEADRMLDMGFAPQIKRILAHVPKERQTLLFSATMPSEIMEIATKHMHLPLSIEVARPGTAAEKVEQELFIVKRDDKMKVLVQLLTQQRGSVLVFSRTKHGAKKITRQLRENGHPAAEIHANRSLAQRREALDGFKSGKYRVLVATDIAARGIDVTGIALVINYDLPDNPDDYVHRIGRTGRAGSVGRAVSLAQPDQMDLLRSIEKLLRGSIPRGAMAGLPTIDPVKAAPPGEPNRREGQGHRGGQRSGGGHGGRSSPAQHGRGAPQRSRPQQGGAHRSSSSHSAAHRSHGRDRGRSEQPGGIVQGNGTVDHGDNDQPHGGRHHKGPGDVLGLS
jgi:ATP-dependent RNA helicase RhlE